MRPGPIGEWTAAIYAGVGSTAAASAAQGRGDHVDVSMFETMVMTMNTYAWINAKFTGDTNPERPGRNVELPSIEPTADGHVGFCTVARQQFLDFLVMIGRPDWLEDEEMCGYGGRWKRRDEFRAAMHAWTTQRTTTEVIAEASARRIPVAPIATGDRAIWSFPAGMPSPSTRRAALPSRLSPTNCTAPIPGPSSRSPPRDSTPARSRPMSPSPTGVSLLPCPWRECE